MKSSEPEYIAIGKILNTHGLKGEVVAEVATDFPERFASAAKVYVDRRPMTIERSELLHGKVILKLHGIDAVEDAEKVKGKLVEIYRSQLVPLPEGQYYHFQLIGLEVRTGQGEVLGKITEIMSTASNDIYLVTGNKREVLLPAVADFIESIDLDKGCLVIKPVKGLVD